jgi:Pyridoxamine 5'-phosphate oxidase
MPAVPTARLLFGADDATPMSTDESTLKEWSDAESQLRAAPKVWLSTGRPDGRPHAMPVLVVWAEGLPCITTRPGSLKARNLAANPACVVTVGGDDLDLVVEGVATRVEDRLANERIAAAFLAKYQWNLSVRDAGVYDDSLPGSPQYGFYRITPVRAFGYGPDGLTATRWQFGDGVA